MHGMVLHQDDPWWARNTPPNGWNCKCKKIGISKEEALARGMEISRAPSENIASKDWDYDPSNPNQPWDNKSTPAIEQQPNYKKEKRPDIQDVDEKYKTPAPDGGKLLEAGKTREEALEIMSKAILGDKKELFVDTPVGKELIRKEMLRHSVQKRKLTRERYANYVIPTLKDPYEVYLTQYADGSRRRMYIGLFDDGSTMLALTIMRDGSLLFNVIIPEKNRYINKKRKGWLIYEKK
jgi:hypothetical protein